MAFFSPLAFVGMVAFHLKTGPQNLPAELGKLLLIFIEFLSIILLHLPFDLVPASFRKFIPIYHRKQFGNFTRTDILRDHAPALTFLSVVIPLPAALFPSHFVLH